jgi:hypothetical protein
MSATGNHTTVLSTSDVHQFTFPHTWGYHGRPARRPRGGSRISSSGRPRGTMADVARLRAGGRPASRREHVGHMSTSARGSWRPQVSGPGRARSSMRPSHEYVIRCVEIGQTATFTSREGHSAHLRNIHRTAELPLSGSPLVSCMVRALLAGRVARHIRGLSPPPDWPAPPPARQCCRRQHRRPVKPQRSLQAPESVL